MGSPLRNWRLVLFVIPSGLRLDWTGLDYTRGHLYVSYLLRLQRVPTQVVSICAMLSAPVNNSEDLFLQKEHPPDEFGSEVTFAL